jgi:ribosomal protein L37AE/L43A
MSGTPQQKPPFCPACGGSDIHSYSNSDSWWCAECGEEFTEPEWRVSRSPAVKTGLAVELDKANPEEVGR